MTQESSGVLTEYGKLKLLSAIWEGIRILPEGQEKNVFLIIVKLLNAISLLQYSLAKAERRIHESQLKIHKDIINGVFSHFRSLKLPLIITQQYVNDFVYMADSLASLSDAVSLVLKGCCSRPRGMATCA